MAIGLGDGFRGCIRIGAYQQSPDRPLTASDPIGRNQSCRRPGRIRSGNRPTALPSRRFDVASPGSGPHD